VYLRAINYKCKIADNLQYFKHYFKLVDFNTKLRGRNTFFYATTANLSTATEENREI
jgi:hypothetical protein